MSYELDSIALAVEFTHWAEGTRLPRGLFGTPDYIALQAESLERFGETVRETAQVAEQITVLEAEDRFIATVKMAGFGIQGFGSVKWLEVREPTFEEVTYGIFRGDAVGFYYNSLSLAKQLLEDRGIAYRLDPEPVPTLKVGYNSLGDEFRLSQVPMSAIVSEHIEDERTTSVRLTP